MEIVLPQEGGKVVDLGYNGALKKDNTGFDLKHLFIGSEGKRSQSEAVACIFQSTDTCIVLSM